VVGNLTEKFRQFLQDPVLRRWLAGRLLGRYPNEPAFVAHRPSYLNGASTPTCLESSIGQSYPVIDSGRPTSRIEIPLPGEVVVLDPGNEHEIFERIYRDIETVLAVHRFAWLPLMHQPVDSKWMSTIWAAWRKNFGTPDDEWPWHPYTAAERAINLVALAETRGLPGPCEDTLAVLDAHGPAIFKRLEYFGDHHTSNHLANNGRGLYFLGLFLGNETYASAGLAILKNEAERIFMPSGILREGSSHYHFLLARNYASAWLMAEKHERPEKEDLKDIARRAMSVIPHLVLSGGMPLIGDISPDCPPEYLSCIAAGEAGWTGTLDEISRRKFCELRAQLIPVSKDILDEDGWLRFDRNQWSGLWHAAPGGWTHMPGHGHQDVGGFEVHFGGEPLFIDPGRGQYGETGEAAEYRSARRHCSLVIDGADPYPPNKPYYGDDFKTAIGGPAPQLTRDANGVRLRHSGYGRFNRVGEIERRWRFEDRTMIIDDRVAGASTRLVERYFHTPLAVTKQGAELILQGKRERFKISTDQNEWKLETGTQWRAYGVGAPIHVIRVGARHKLPWQSSIRIEAL